MPNTINIVQPKAEDGTPVSYVTRTNSIFKSDGSPLGDSMDAYMDEVDELQKNNLGSAVDISSYTTTANLYTCPTDGYVVMDTSSSASAWVNMEIYSATTNVSFIVSTNNSRNAVFVKKGMRVRRAGGSGTSNVSFYSLQ